MSGTRPRICISSSNTQRAKQEHNRTRRTLQPDTHLTVHKRVLPSTFAHPWAGYHVPGVFLECKLTLTHKARNTTRVQIRTQWNPCGEPPSHHISTQQSHQENWFHSLPFQQFQALLTLFSKSFSPFPHGTCLLSVSNQYLALDEIYHPLYAPIPRNATLRRHAVYGGLRTTNGTLTLVDALFQEAYICASVGGTSPDYNSRPWAPISILSFSLFIRHY